MITSKCVRFRRGAGKLPVLLSLVAVGVIAYGAYRLLFNRVGEAAIQLIPQDAVMVVTLDTNPSETQIPTFKRISDVLKAEGITDQIDKGLTDMFNRDPLGKDLRPYVTTNFAFASFDSESKRSYVMLTSVKDAGKVGELLAAAGKKVKDQPPIYQIEKMSTFCAVIGGYLAVSDAVGPLERIDAVREQKEPSLAALDAYVAARSALPADANLMVFVSPSGIHELQKMSGSKNLGSATWLTVGATIRDDGIQVDYRGPVDAKDSAMLKSLSAIPPLDVNLLRKLPANAYGVMSVSQLSQYWKAAQDELGSNKDSGREIVNGIAEFEKETGLSVPKDIVPAFRGNATFAVYPGPSSQPEDFDFLLSLDDASEADPAALFAKLRLLVERKSKEEGKKVGWVETKLGDVTLWEIDAKTRKEIVSGMGDWKAAKDKSLIIALQGKSLTFSTSRALINQAIEARSGGASLANDPAFTAMERRVVEGSQSNIMISLGRVMQAMRPMFEEQMKDGPIKVDDLVNLFGGLDTGLVGSGKFDGNATTGTFFMPLNYERMIRMIGAGVRASSKPEPDFQPQ